MTKAAAYQAFWESFGLAAFEENSVPDGEFAPDYPYITYEFMSDSLGSEVMLSASLWYRSTAWTEANDKADEIGAAIGMGGVIISCDGGGIWIKRGSPFAQSMGDERDDMIKRKLLNITAEYLTAD